MFDVVVINIMKVSCICVCMYACRHILSILKGKSGTYPQRFAWARWSFSNLLQYIRNCIGQWSLCLLRERNDIYSSYVQYNAHTAHQLSFADEWKLLWDIWIEIHLCMYILLVHVNCSSKNESRNIIIFLGIALIFSSLIISFFKK